MFADHPLFDDRRHVFFDKADQAKAEEAY